MMHVPGFEGEATCGSLPGHCADGTVNDKPPKILAHCHLSFILLLINEETKLQSTANDVED
jgi:hypothetical protein